MSFNHPGCELALSDLLHTHVGLRSIGVVEAEPMSRMERTFHLDARAKEMIGRALLETDGSLSFLQCDIFAINEKTTTLPWRSSAQCDGPPGVHVAHEATGVCEGPASLPGSL